MTTAEILPPSRNRVLEPSIGRSPAPGARPLTPDLRVSVLDDQRTVFGDHEMRLLDAIAREGTLTEGAATRGLSYRSAWGKLKNMEVALGAKLVESTVGGRSGGSSRLTPEARRLLDQYSRFRSAVEAYAEQEFARCFGEDAASAEEYR